MQERPTLIGRRFGMLSVIAQAPSSARGNRRWLCQCDCGTPKIILGSNLTRGSTVSCGCKHKKELSGQRIGNLTVIGRSDKYGPRGKRRVQLWECRCDCGAITYKATDYLTNSHTHMCQDCAAKYVIAQARANLGLEEGTQISKISNRKESSQNLSGVRGVYLDKKTRRYRARLKFQGKQYELGSYTLLEDAIKARRRGEEEIFDAFLSQMPVFAGSGNPQNPSY